MGINGDESILYLLDFGMVKRIKTNRNTHIHQSDGHDLIGNSRYCSIHSHKGISKYLWVIFTRRKIHQYSFFYLKH